MSKVFSMIVAALMLTVSVAAVQPVFAGTTGAYGQSEQTGPYAAGGSANPMQR